MDKEVRNKDLDDPYKEVWVKREDGMEVLSWIRKDRQQDDQEFSSTEF